MIMAGRGRRLDIGDQPNKIGPSLMGSVDETADSATLKKKINEINTADLNSATFMNISNLFIQLCSSKESTRDLLNDLHNKALSEPVFGEKLIIVLEQLPNLEVNGFSLRGELLTLIQNDFEVKETMYKSDPQKFMNAVTLLGGVYNRIKVCGAPIAVLGIALVEYFDFLIKGGEEELKLLTKQILSNGKTLSGVPVYDEFQVKLRNSLLNGSQNHLSKCWILLIIDLISNNLKPLKGSLNEFYISNLKDDYIKLMSVIPNISDNLKVSPQKTNSPGSTPSKNHQFESDLCNIRKGLSKKFSATAEKTEQFSFKGKKEKGQISPGRNFKKDTRKGNKLNKTTMSEHDDRFVKDEDYYGVQKPRQPKTENKKFDNDKAKKNECIKSETSSE